MYMRYITTGEIHVHALHITSYRRNTCTCMRYILLATGKIHVHALYANYSMYMRYSYIQALAATTCTLSSSYYFLILRVPCAVPHTPPLSQFLG